MGILLKVGGKSGRRQDQKQGQVYMPVPAFDFL